MDQLLSDLSVLRGHVRTQVDLVFNHHAQLTGVDTSPAAAEPIQQYNTCLASIPTLTQQIVTIGYHSGSVDLATYSQGLAEYLRNLQTEIDATLSTTLDEAHVQAVYSVYTNVEACIDYCIALAQGLAQVRC